MTSGPNQHYIPAFVQRAFRIPQTRFKIWSFEQDKQPERREIKRTASEDNFYSEPRVDSFPTLDDKITDIENKVACIFHKIRTSIASGNSVEPDDAATIIAHLAPRTAHLRNNFNYGFSEIITRARSIFSDPEMVKVLTGLDHLSPNERFREQILSDQLKRPEVCNLNLPEPVLERFVFYIAKENTADFISNKLPFINSRFDGLQTKVGELARDNHNEIVAEILIQSRDKTFYEHCVGQYEHNPTLW